MEATTNDNDANDADMHARAGDAELILRATQKQSAVMMVVCYSGAAATAGAAGALDTSKRVLAVTAVVICSWLQHVRPSFQSMKRQPAARCCGLPAFCAAVCANESSSCRSTDVVKSRLTRSKLDSASKKNSTKCFATTLRIEFLKARTCARSNGCVYAVKFRCSTSPGCACMSASIASIMS